VTQALFGFIGVIVGALLAGASQYVLLRRRERAEARVARRLVAWELENLDHLLYTAGRFAFDSQTFSTAAFSRYQDVLARELPDAEWLEVAEAYVLLDSTREIASFNEQEALREQATERLEDQVKTTLTRAIWDARQILAGGD
jgi:hypothetical protein